MKKIIVKMTAILLIASILLPANVHAGIDIFINNNWVAAEAINHKGRVLVPVRGVFETLGYTVTYDSNTKTASLIGDKHITLTNGQDYFWCDSKIIKPDVPQQIINSKFYLPLRAVAEALGGDVWWDGAEQNVYLSIDAPYKPVYASIYDDKDELPVSINNEFSVITQPDGSEINVTTLPDGTEVISYTDTSKYSTYEQRKESYPSNNSNVYSDSYNTHDIETYDSLNNNLVDPKYVTEMEKEVVRLVNIERAKEGLALLEWDNSLASAARNHSIDMAKREYSAHVNPEGLTWEDRVKNEGGNFSIVDENIASGILVKTPESAVGAWMSSTPHKGKILRGSHEYAGVGFYYSATSPSKCYWTIDFGTK